MISESKSLNRSDKLRDLEMRRLTAMPPPIMEKGKIYLGFAELPYVSVVTHK
jgi:hypothetical protein